MSQGRKAPVEPSLFIPTPDLYAHIPKRHFYVPLDARLDLAFVRPLTAPLYAATLGRPSLDPVVFVKAMLVAFFESIVTACPEAAVGNRTMTQMGRHPSRPARSIPLRRRNRDTMAVARPPVLCARAKEEGGAGRLNIRGRPSERLDVHRRARLRRRCTMTTHTSSLFALLAMSLAGALAADGFETAGCISAAQRDSMVVVSVLDWGRGIAAEDLPRIFDRFYRPSLGRKPGGIGLGLYITRALVEAQGGHISVESEVGRGSTFTLPVPPRDEDQA